MDDVRLALLGDKAVQERLTERGELLPCPHCKGKGKVHEKRLTSARQWCEAKNDLKNELGYSHIWCRLNAIEDILGDDYDLDRLRDLVQADREGRCVGHGEWLYAETDDEQFFLCSVCNNKEYWESNCCPECGAKMDEEQEE